MTQLRRKVSLSNLTWTETRHDKSQSESKESATVDNCLGMVVPCQYSVAPLFCSFKKGGIFCYLITVHL